ncbi:MAG: coenzyme F420-0:L-glutamate ligase [Rhodospirillaceae bacterium]|jgi:coenzyme F420-0:L-glutamate ligase / coenzyme F420-1:gamma-L-glutamate ligase|nr:coenzyme F420-0:L-glutamate ligase [Rhodospirillaceae bacterium]MBT5456933.1 coenzyme F420-0:L-glutamate ligase [Rhodospirillaceae bacterium]
MDQPRQPSSDRDLFSRHAAKLTITALDGIPLVQPGDDLAGLLLSSLEGMGESFRDGDILVLAQKIVSKSEGRYVDLADVTPSARALELAGEVDKDPRLVEVILSEAVDIVRYRKGVLVVAHRCGAVLANAGIDRSNIDQPDDGNELGTSILLLPEDPDRSCAALRKILRQRTGAHIGIVINDSLGRAWRNGTVGAAIGAAGIEALLDLNGRPDLFDRPLQSTQVGLADELAAAASLVMGQADEGRPAVLIRGLAGGRGEGTAADLVRPRDQDLFR